MKTLACTKIACPNDPKRRHSVTLRGDGTVTCDCADGRERGASYAGRLMLGLPPIEGARGCAVLAALVDGADALLYIEHTLDRSFGSWTESVAAYRQNPIYRAALDLAASKVPERGETEKLVVQAVESCGYRHALGKRAFRESFGVAWDVPATSTLDRIGVAAFDDDRWLVPYMPGWREEIHDQQLAVIGGRFVCGRSATDPSIFYAIAPNEHGGHWVRAHRRVKNKLIEIAE